MEICENIKWPLFLHVPISLKKILFTIVGHGMNMIVEVLLPCLWTLPIYTYDNEFDDEEVDEDCFEEPWVVDMCGLMTLNDTCPNVEKRKDHNQPSSTSTPIEKTLA
jgi:hypothetical protein